MEKFAYSDGSKLCLANGEQTVQAESEYIAKYRERTAREIKNNEWKYSGSGARFRGDTFEEHGIDTGARVDAYVNSVNVGEGEEILYTFTVNGTSGVIRKDLSRPKDNEAFILHTNDCEIGASDYNLTDRKFVAERKTDAVTSDIVLLNVENGDYSTITEGDSRDENPCFSKSKAGVVLFNSYPVGRNAHGDFCEYGPSSLYSYDLETMQLDEIKASADFSYIKPRDDEEGNLYCIKKPQKEKRRGNPFLEILLIPVRILQAIANFIQVFVVMFSGKTMTGGGNNPAKGRDVDSRKVFIKGNVIKVDEEIARNKKFKDKDLSFIPASWKLVQITPDGEKEIKRGICDFCLTSGGILCTNGRKIFFIKDGKCEKQREGDFILSVASPTHAQKSADIFKL